MGKGDGAGRLLAGRYQLVEKAGEGGMATVWRALTRGAAGFHRPVAIKRIKRGVASDPAFVRMFVEEARVGADLDHPNVVQIHDFGVDESEQHYLVMEWVEGVDLGRWSRSYVKAGWHAPWHLVAAMGIEALQGLYAAHTRFDVYGRPAPTYHRDVAPGNVLLGSNGVVKLADFGLARAMDRARVTQPDILKGKLAYLAPELIEDAPASPQSDIFGLGVVLWEVFAGRKLFRARNDIETLERVSKAEVPSLAALRPDLPPELVAVVHRALARHPDLRWDSARQMARALAAILRTVAEPTDGPVLGESVALARKRLGLRPRNRAPEALRQSTPPPPPPAPHAMTRAGRK
ncbi:MAG: serine/threonine-protein kinase [Sandaracinaceae bacterium]